MRFSIFCGAPPGLKIAKSAFPVSINRRTYRSVTTVCGVGEWWFGDSFYGFNPEKPLSRPIMTEPAVEAESSRQVHDADKTFCFRAVTHNWER